MSGAYQKITLLDKWNPAQKLVSDPARSAARLGSSKTAWGRGLRTELPSAIKPRRNRPAAECRARRINQ